MNTMTRIADLRSVISHPDHTHLAHIVHKDDVGAMLAANQIHIVSELDQHVEPIALVGRTRLRDEPVSQLRQVNVYFDDLEEHRPWRFDERYFVLADDLPEFVHGIVRQHTRPGATKRLSNVAGLFPSGFRSYWWSSPIYDRNDRRQRVRAVFPEAIQVLDLSCHTKLWVSRSYERSGRLANVNRYREEHGAFAVRECEICGGSPDLLGVLDLECRCNLIWR